MFSDRFDLSERNIKRPKYRFGEVAAPLPGAIFRTSDSSHASLLPGTPQIALIAKRFR
jgi:hypothetical protein